MVHQDEQVVQSWLKVKRSAPSYTQGPKGKPLHMSKEQHMEPAKEVIKGPNELAKGEEKWMSEGGWFDAYPGEQYAQNTVDGVAAFDQIIRECEEKGWRRWADNGPHGFHPADWFAGNYPVGGMQDGKAAHHWTRISDWSGAIQLFPAPVEDHEQTHVGRVYQGGLSNYYMVEALQAIALRPKLAKSLFIRCDCQRGIYVVRTYVNGVWNFVVVDDFIPVDPRGKPLTCFSEYFPFAVWATILEKAQAKIHFSYENLNGGYAEDAIADITGGAAGRFLVGAVDSSRLFLYMQALQGECLWIGRVREKACEAHGVALARHTPYCVHRVVDWEGRGFVQLMCGAALPQDGALNMSIPHGLWARFPERTAQGFIWLGFEDFHMYFHTCIEARLVNSDPRSTAAPLIPRRLPDMVPPWVPKRGIYEELSAFRDGEDENGKEVPDRVFRPGRSPACFVRVMEAPCEVTVVFSQGNKRMDSGRKGEARWGPMAAVRLNCFQRKSGSDEAYQFVCASNWLPRRDASVSVKCAQTGILLVHCQIGAGPVQTISRAIFRAYGTGKIGMTAAEVGEVPGDVPPEPEPAVIPWSLYSADKISAPVEWDEQEGVGRPTLVWAEEQGGNVQAYARETGDMRRLAKEEQDVCSVQ